VSGWEGRGGLVGSRVGVFSDLENAKGFLFCFLTWVGRLGLGGLCLFQCLAVLDLSDESWVLCFLIKMVCVPISQQNGTSVSVLVGFLKRKFNLGFVLGNPGPVWECA